MAQWSYQRLREGPAAKTGAAALTGDAIRRHPAERHQLQRDHLL